VRRAHGAVLRHRGLHRVELRAAIAVARRAAARARRRAVRAHTHGGGGGGAGAGRHARGHRAGKLHAGFIAAGSPSCESPFVRNERPGMLLPRRHARCCGCWSSNDGRTPPSPPCCAWAPSTTRRKRPLRCGSRPLLALCVCLRAVESVVVHRRRVRRWRSPYSAPAEENRQYGFRRRFSKDALDHLGVLWRLLGSGTGVGASLTRKGSPTALLHLHWTHAD
jgi:hypothetical protein